jgi:hypothetical protein
MPASLPPLSLAGLPNLVGSSAKTYRALDLCPLRVLLCDGRTFRESNKSNPAALLLGSLQEQWLLAEIAGSTKPVLIVSGSTMTDGDDQSWDRFKKFFNQRFLPATSSKIVMFLGGDVHENRLHPPPSGFPLEIVCSGAAVGLIFRRRNFGVLDVTPAEAKIRLYKKGATQYSGRLDLVSGAFTLL